VLDQIWNAILDLMARFVIPDWGSLIALLPIAVLALIVLFVGSLAMRTASLGPKRRGRGRRKPVPPPGVHLPGPTFAPIFGAVGVALLLFGLVFGGQLILLGLIALVLTLLYWGAEAMRDYDHTANTGADLPAIVHPGPPPGVHMPGPSFRPIVAAIAVAVLLFGLVFGGWFLAAGLAMLVISLVGWLRDAGVEYHLAERADLSGHLDPLPEPRVPTRTFALFGALFGLAIVLNSGLIPAGAANGASGGSPAPAGSGAPGGSPGGSPAASLPAADVTETAQDVKFETTALTATADKALTIAFVNKDAGVPHNMQFRDPTGATLFEGDTVTGPGSAVYTLPPLKAGTYKFVCKWHPTMVGELTVK
jgi:plastocyanin